MNIKSISRFPMSAIALLCTATASGQVVNENLKILASDGGLSTNLGHALSIDNGIVVAGAPYHNDGDENYGSVYLYDASTGVEIRQLFKDPAASDYEFGKSVDIDNGLIAVGSPNGYENSARSGTAYVFSTDTGTQLLRVYPPTGSPDDEFGHAVAIDDGILVVGAYGEDYNGVDETGAAYIYDANTGALLHELHPAGAIQESQFGISVAIDNGIVAIGAIDHSNGSGKSYVYLFDAATGNQIVRLQGNQALNFEMFGYSIDINNNILAVGSPRDQDNGYRSGSVYLFNASNGSFITNIYPDDASLQSEQQFGSSVSLDDGLLAVGTQFDPDMAIRAGAAYVFSTSSYSQIAKLLASDGAQVDYLGISVAIEGDTVFAGAPGVDDQASQSGAIYQFSVPDDICPADLTGDFVLDFFDISAFLTAYANQDPIADFSDDGLFDFFDISAFLTAYSAGCP